MNGVTTAIVLYIFACVGYPQLIKNRPQFYAALGLLLLIILFDCIGHLPFPALASFAYFINALFQIGAIALLVMSTGGKSLRELTGDMSETIEVVRRGGETETLIVQPPADQPKPRVPPPAAPRKPADKSSIPLD
jgi:hypothetical protein